VKKFLAIFKPGGRKSLNCNELLNLDGDSPTIEEDFSIFLKQRAVLIENAIAEKNTVLLEEIIAADQENLTHLRASRTRVGDYLVNIGKVIKYDDGLV
jgi:hypothetical protein